MAVGMIVQMNNATQQRDFLWLPQAVHAATHRDVDCQISMNSQQLIIRERSPSGFLELTLSAQMLKTLSDQEVLNNVVNWLNSNGGGNFQGMSQKEMLGTMAEMDDEPAPKKKRVTMGKWGVKKDRL